MNNCLDIINSSSLLPLPLVSFSCHVLDLELLSIVMSMANVFSSSKMSLINLISLSKFSVISIVVCTVRMVQCGTARTVHTTYAAALKTTTHPQTRCRKPYAATQHLMLLMMGVCARNMSS